MAARMPGPDAGGGPRRTRPGRARARAGRVAGLAAPCVVVPATAGRAGRAFAGGGLQGAA